MVGLAVGASVLLCFDVLSLDPDSTRGVIVRSLDIVFTFFFGVEVRAHEQAYRCHVFLAIIVASWCTGRSGTRLCQCCSAIEHQPQQASSLGLTATLGAKMHNPDA